jgi:signal transduction histidine kinase
VPISAAGTIMGSMILSVTRPDRRYGADDLALAEEFAHRAALALQSARSYHLAQAALRSRDEMLAVVAHDLRNPLNTIVMGSDLALEMAPQDSTGRVGIRQFEIIRRTAQHMNRLIQDLLDASRLDSGTLALEKATLKPADLLREANEMLAPLAAQSRIAFQTEPAEDLPTICADRGRLLQVLSNLVGNALKFTPEGGVISVTAVTGDDVTAAERHITFTVRDTGCGIPADQLPHIFARGWQARRGDRRGIGLGLAIASGIVQAHGGSIWVESVVGDGSRFMFTVPAA